MIRFMQANKNGKNNTTVANQNGRNHTKSRTISIKVNILTSYWIFLIIATLLKASYEEIFE